MCVCVCKIKTSYQRDKQKLKRSIINTEYTLKGLKEEVFLYNKGETI